MRRADGRAAQVGQDGEGRKYQTQGLGTLGVGGDEGVQIDGLAGFELGRDFLDQLAQELIAGAGP